MNLVVGAIVEGKVTGITKFGAFVALPGGGSGLVHISEIAHAYVNDVHDYLSMGQSVSVKVLSISPEGKVNLSIKQTQPAPAQPVRSQNTLRAQSTVQPIRQAANNRSAAEAGVVRGPSSDASFEDKLKQFMQESDSRMVGNKLYAERKNTNRRRK